MQDELEGDEQLLDFDCDTNGQGTKPDTKSKEMMEPVKEVKQDIESKLRGTEVERQPLAFVTTLAPEELLILNVGVNGIEYKALIDTGATNNLVRKDIISKEVELDKSKLIVITGLAKSEIRTEGKVLLEMDFLGLDYIMGYFDVVPSDSIDFDMILGLDFLRQHKFVIDFSKRRVSQHSDDGSRTDYYADKKGTLLAVVHENVPVFALKDTKVNEGLTSVQVYMKIYFSSREYDNDMYFEGKARNTKVKGLDGIIDLEKNDIRVMMHRKPGELNNYTIKKDEEVGRASTLITLQPGDNPENKHEQWTLDKIIEEVDIGKQNSEEQRNQIYKMLLLTHGALGRNDDEIGKANVVPHVIELNDRTPLWQRPRRFADPVNIEIERQCEELLKLGIIEPSSSQFSSPVVPVRKKDGSLRLCIDYRKINSVTKTDKFPMPNLNDSIYSAHNINYFSKLDLIKGYYQIPLDEESKQFTAFSTPHNHYQFKRLSFGLKNSGIAFQRNMQEILSEYSFKNVIVYIDDILIMTQTFQEHVVLVGKILLTLQNNGIKIKVSKCEFFKPEVTFLGHIISNIGIRKSPEYIDKIRKYPKPTTVTGLRQFLGLVNFQCKFIEQCSVIAKPLSQLTGGPKKQVLVWSPEMNSAFDTLKAKLLEDVLLSYPDYSSEAEKLELFVDASGIGVGGCLVQKQNGKYCTIAYSSMTFSQAQTKYSTIERELVAIRWGVKTFRPFIFGVPFILYTDHKPLLYLHNMSHENSRLMRTITELAEYDFTIKYRPGKENAAADTMSRIVEVPSEQDYNNLVSQTDLPKGFRLLETIEGGGNSLFESIMASLEYLKEEHDLSLPEDHLELRKLTVNHLFENPDKFNIKMNKMEKKRLNVMKCAGQVPSEEILLATCDLLGVEIWVYHGMPSPVVFKSSSKTTNDLITSPIVHLQCISGIHFNPLFPISKKVLLRENITNKNFVRLDQVKEQIKIEDSCSELREEEERVRALIAVHTVGLICKHNLSPVSSCIVNVGDTSFCALLDTGAQICLLSEKVWNILKLKNPCLNLLDGTGNILNGIDKSQSTVLGIVELQLSILDFLPKSSLPFAVIKEADIPCCCVIGANFLSKNELIIDYNDLILCNSSHNLVYPLGVDSQYRSDNYRYNISALICSLTNSEADAVDSCCSSDHSQSKNVRFTLDTETLVALQNNDHAITSLKEKLTNSVPVARWKLDCLNQFKRHHKYLRVQLDLLLRDCAGKSVPVVPFPLLVEIIHKVHIQLGHVGRSKMIEVVSKNFWHPAIDSVTRDVCNTCIHCQLFKISSQPISPPTMKIQANHPFDLVAMDLLQFTKSSHNNVAVLVAIDHFSKFLFAIPLKDKRAFSVVKAVREQILPHILKIPHRILTDNGPEFRSSEFNDILENFNIKHIYSTRYKASGNGAVERSNRTITELLKGLINENPTSWDIELPKAVIIYNNTLHSQLGTTPAQYILETAHKFDHILPVDSNTLSTWREGHPKFSPFKLNQRVAYKINKIGNQLKYKLGKKYLGPFKIAKVQSNGVTYELQECKLGDEAPLVKVHHKQIKLWNDPPQYLKEYIGEIDQEVVSRDESLSSSDDSLAPFLGFITDSSDTSDSSSESSSEGSSNTSNSNKNSHRSVRKGKSSSDSKNGTVTQNGQPTQSDFSNTDTLSDNDTLSEDTQKENVPTMKPISLSNHSLLPLSSKQSVQIAGLHCSEPVNYIDGIHHCSSFLGNHPISGLSVVEGLSPIHGSLGNLQVGEARHSLSAVPAVRLETAVSVDMSNLEQNEQDISDFCQFLEQSLSVSEELLDRVVHSFTDESEKGDGVKEVDRRVYAQSPVAPLCQADEQSFVGFGEDDSIAKSSVKLEALRILGVQLGKVKENVTGFRNNRQFLRQMWHRRYMASESRLDVGDSVETEVSDIVTDLPIFAGLSSTPRRVTRSLGTADDLPNVQSRTLEYRLKRK